MKSGLSPNHFATVAPAKTAQNDMWFPLAYSQKGEYVLKIPLPATWILMVPAPMKRDKA